MAREFNIVNSFTLECSFCGPNIGLFKDCHFNMEMLKVSDFILIYIQEIGKSFCRALYDYSDP